MADTVRITQLKSSAGASRKQLETLSTLGLRRIGSTVERPERPELDGLVRSVAHLVRVER